MGRPTYFYEGDVIPLTLAKRFSTKISMKSFRKISQVFAIIRVVPELEILTILPDLTTKFTKAVKKCGKGNGVRELYST